MAAISWQAFRTQLAPTGLLTEQLPSLGWGKLPVATSSMSSWQSLLLEGSWLMGRRDKRTCKGKVFKGSSGNVRLLLLIRGTDCYPFSYITHGIMRVPVSKEPS